MAFEVVEHVEKLPHTVEVLGGGSNHRVHRRHYPYGEGVPIRIDEGAAVDAEHEIAEIGERPPLPRPQPEPLLYLRSTEPVDVFDAVIEFPRDEWSPQSGTL